MTDIWTGDDMGCVSNGINTTVATHDTAGFLVGKACQESSQSTSSVGSSPSQTSSSPGSQTISGGRRVRRLFEGDNIY